MTLNLPRNLRIAATAVAGHLLDDPARFALLASQRFPSGFAKPVAALLDRFGPLGEAYAEWMRGHRDDAVAKLENLPPQRGRKQGLFANLAIAADRPDLLEGNASATAPVLEARAKWQLGELSQALAALEHSYAPSARKYRRVLEGEQTLLTPIYRLPSSAMRIPQAPRSSAPRVLHLLTNSLPHTQSGYTLRSHEILKAQRDAGMAVLAVTRIGYPVTVGKLGAHDVDIVDGIEYHRVLPGRLGSTMPDRLDKQVRELDSIVARFQPTVIHTTTNYTNALVAQSLAARHSLPWTYEVRGMLEKTWATSRATEAAREAAASSERFQLMHAREAELAKAASHVFTISSTMRDELVERGVPADKISLIPNSIDGQLLERSSVPAEVRAELGLPSEGFWAGAVSSLVDYEGHDLLIDAVGQMRTHGIDARVLIAGDGASRPELLQLANALGDAAHLPGRVSPELAKRYVEALDAVVVARRDLEVTRSVTPLKPIEAMALGRPVVVSDLPPLRELVGENKRGVVVEADSATAVSEALTMLATDASRNVELAAAGKQFASSMTWDSAATEYRRVFTDLEPGS
ncbi:glycosyltransferase family 4 protein [Gulosibacter sp. ACHW.36C]|uniref:D-inositol 3-phosphate glycosyltransferase n=1 Tax=Gulosibacter sediminis TaxID=1729695 RepID=A0ABY4MXI4_9MICO|nr:glycosyltransferase family 4 protein [Gulosibacter sediminis]UQN15099.1 glycosyltransferase family 4 protein [Gulosibacter sediminis]